MTNLSPKQPWYKNWLVWLAFSPAIVGVLVGLSLLVVGTIYFDGTVHEDYYKQGRIIDQSFEMDQYALAKNLQAELQFNQGRLQMQLSGDLTSFPDQLVVLMENPTRAALDFSIPLQHLGSGQYLGNLPQEFAHDWDIKLYGPNREWRLYGRENFPSSRTLTLLPSKR